MRAHYLAGMLAAATGLMSAHAFAAPPQPTIEFEAGPTRPGATIVDVAGETLLPAVEIDGGNALAGLHQGHSNMQGGGGFARPTLLVAQHDDVRSTGTLRGHARDSAALPIHTAVS